MKYNTLFFLIVVFLLASLTNAGAKDYYVSTSGSDIPANISSPGPGTNACRTIMYIVNNAVLSGGDTIYIQSGTYLSFYSTTKKVPNTTNSDNYHYL